LPDLKLFFLAFVAELEPELALNSWIISPESLSQRLGHNREVLRWRELPASLDNVGARIGRLVVAAIDRSASDKEADEPRAKQGRDPHGGTEKGLSDRDHRRGLSRSGRNHIFVVTIWASGG
jgi:hypothetical protein